MKKTIRRLLHMQILSLFSLASFLPSPSHAVICQLSCLSLQSLLKRYNVLPLCKEFAVKFLLHSKWKLFKNHFYWDIWLFSQRFSFCHHIDWSTWFFFVEIVLKCNHTICIPLTWLFTVLFIHWWFIYHIYKNYTNNIKFNCFQQNLPQLLTKPFLQTSFIGGSFLCVYESAINFSMFTRPCWRNP